MNEIVSIDEAIDLLMEYKRKGGEVVIISEKEIESGLMQMGIFTSVKCGIDIIAKTNNPIAFAENELMKSLMTEMNKKYKTILFCNME